MVNLESRGQSSELQPNSEKLKAVIRLQDQRSEVRASTWKLNVKHGDSEARAQSWWPDARKLITTLTVKHGSSEARAQSWSTDTCKLQTHSQPAAINQQPVDYKVCSQRHSEFKTIGHRRVRSYSTSHQWQANVLVCRYNQIQITSQPTCRWFIVPMTEGNALVVWTLLCVN